MGTCCSVAPFPDAVVEAHSMGSRRSSAQNGSSRTLKQRRLSGSPADAWGRGGGGTNRAAPGGSSSKQVTPSGSKCRIDHISGAESETFLATPNPITTSMDDTELHSPLPQEINSGGAPTSVTSEVCPLTQRNLEMFASLSSAALPPEREGALLGSKDTSQHLVWFPTAPRSDAADVMGPQTRGEAASRPSSTTASVEHVLALLVDSESHVGGHLSSEFAGDPHIVSAFAPLQMPAHLWPSEGSRELMH